MKKGVIILAIVTCVAAALPRPAAAQTDDPRCNDRLIQGTYGFTLVGDKLAGPGPVGPQVGVAMTPASSPAWLSCLCLPHPG